MDPALKQRLVGAGVLVALAVIFLPMLVQGPAPDSGVADVALDVPDAPAGEFETRELPLVDLEARPDAGVVGMETPQQPQPAQPQPADTTDPAPAPVSTPVPELPSDSGEMYPAATAGGDYAVSYGSYSTTAAADAAVASLRSSQLPGYREAARVGSQTLHRVRIGPFASRADAEAARQRVTRFGRHEDAKVLALDAETEAGDAPAAAKPVAEKPAAAKPAAARPAAADVGFAVQLAAFSRQDDANKLRDRARALGFSAFTETVATDKGDLVRVRLGPVSTRAEAEQLQARAKAKMAMAGVVRPHP
ncbi:MAG: SPOR domain-containing protein [Pseudomonadota bacterium]|nr:SPOR domain-containing protein [Pseudomonadota bacterium]